MEKEYYKEHLLDILKEEDIDKDILIELLSFILESTILNRSTEDLEYRLSSEKEME